MDKNTQMTEVLPSAPVEERENGGIGPVIRIGQLGKPHGIRGEINFTFTTDVWDNVDAEYLLLKTDGILVPFYLDEYRFRTDTTALLHFDGLDTVDDIQEYSGCEVYFPYSLLPEEDDSEYTWQHLVGYSIVDTQLGHIGEILRVDDSTPNVLFELQDGSLLPAAEDLICDVDHTERVLHMQLPDGLFDLD